MFLQNLFWLFIIKWKEKRRNITACHAKSDFSYWSRWGTAILLNGVFSYGNSIGAVPFLSDTIFWQIQAILTFFYIRIRKELLTLRLIEIIIIIPGSDSNGDSSSLESFFFQNKFSIFGEYGPEIVLYKVIPKRATIMN